ncbi:carbohydrate ABC transporter permease [Streptomyces cadmiisoli]|uniref:carbohydrate ABC transporter permease n=1 Tax=Streptomyces cadmiisoli TaxID=2184053 RepID=UPI00365E4B40
MSGTNSAERPASSGRAAAGTTDTPAEPAVTGKAAARPLRKAAGVGTRTTSGGTPLRPDRLSRHNLSGWLYSTPFLAFFVTFMAVPILATLVMSFTDFGLRNVTNPFDAEFVGLENYSELLGDEQFLRALFNTGYFVVLGVPLTIGCGLLAAVLLNSGIERFRTFFRVGFYAPVVTAIVAVAVVWRFVLDPSEGLIAGLAAQVGLTAPDFLASESLAMPSLIAMAVWRNLGTSMVLFLAGLQAIPTEVREAAKLDGAGAFQEFRRITVPLLRPTMLYVTVMTTIGFLNVFEEPFVMTNGGPSDSTLTVSLLMYREGFNFFNMGYASSMAYTLFVIILAVTLLQMRLLKDKTK